MGQMGFLHKDMWRGNSDVKKGQMGILHKEMWRGNSDFKKEEGWKRLLRRHRCTCSAMQHTFLPRYDLWIEIYLRSHTQLISNWCELGIGDPSRSVSRKHVFLFQWTVNGDNGTDGILAQRHVEGELRVQLGGFRNMSKMVGGPAWETNSKIGNATHILAAQVRLKWIDIYLRSHTQLINYWCVLDST